MSKEFPAWHPLAAFAAPFLLFAVLTSIEGFDVSRPWYPVLYSIKTVLLLGLLYWSRRYYPAWSSQGLGIGLIFGVLGGVLWIILCTWNLEQDVLPALFTSLNLPSLADWLKPGTRVGYHPFAELSPAGAWMFTGIRFVGLVLVVPLMEELFWRGFLNRFLIDENWQQVPWGRITPLSLGIVTVAFVAVHAEWTAALAWGLGIGFVYWYTRNLWACIIAHAVSNAVLGCYILAYQQWHLW